MSLHKTSFKVADFISWQKKRSLALSPKFQRRAVWKSGAKSYLIDTILRDFPVPIVFLRDLGTDPKTLEPQREVVDGQQRLRTILTYVAPQFLNDYNPEKDDFSILKAHNKDAAGKTFAELDSQNQQAILNYEFSVQVLPSSMDDREVVQLFRRLNSTNYALNKQELRNASFFGHFKSSALLLSAEQLHRWREWKTFSDDDISRMNEVDFTSECMLSIIRGKVAGKTPKTLDAAYEEFDHTFLGREEMEKRFRTAMELIANNFAVSHAKSPLLRKRLIYVLVLAIVDACFALDSSVTKRVSAKKISPDSWANLAKVSDQLQNREAPGGILKSMDRRTTHPKERRELFNYLKGCF